MQFLTDTEIAETLPWPQLIAAVERFVLDGSAESPPRTVHTLAVPGQPDASLLMKPAWLTGDVIGVKVVTVFGQNGRLGLPTIQAGMLLFDGLNGTLVGACEANELTTRRTAAASAVAAARLVRGDAERLLVVGTGALAPMVALAHAGVRPYRVIEVWGRDRSKAAAVVDRLAGEGLTADVCTDLDRSVGLADTITCVTGATSPLVCGALLRPGAHVDLIGSFDSSMRESDDDVVRRAALFVDSRQDAVLAGDLAQPLAAGIIGIGDIRADLRELVAGDHPGRCDDDEITVYKSVGMAVEDLAAASLAFG